MKREKKLDLQLAVVVRVTAKEEEDGNFSAQKKKKIEEDHVGDGQDLLLKWPTPFNI